MKKPRRRTGRRHRQQERVLLRRELKRWKKTAKLVGNALFDVLDATSGLGEGPVYIYETTIKSLKRAVLIQAGVKDLLATPFCDNTDHKGRAPRRPREEAAPRPGTRRFIRLRG